MNFNSLHGCLKCCTVGHHSTLLRTNIFPNTSAIRRTDSGFRKWMYEGHYQPYKIRENGKLFKQPIITPLLKLPIDIVEDVIVSDSLHLLHLGVMKKLLLAYRDGHNGLDAAKWSKDDIKSISKQLDTIRLPLEIHRSVRSIETVNHWKASECASFLNYIGIILLKQFLKESHFINFSNLFCAVTICSSSYFHRFLPVAKILFKDFITNYHRQFNSATSNIHNLAHVVDEVQRFGALPSISSYPFENHLHQIKKLVRTGRLPLSQIINRLSEKSSYNPDLKDKSVPYPSLKNPFKEDNNKYSIIQLSKNFTLKNSFPDKWFLMNDKTIVAMNYADSNGINGSELLRFDNLFMNPLPSMNILVFYSSDITCKTQKMYPLQQILCKLVAIVVNNEVVFVPLHHTLPSTECM